MLLLAKAAQDQAVPVTNASLVQSVWYSCAEQSIIALFKCIAVGMSPFFGGVYWGAPASGS